MVEALWRRSAKHGVIGGYPYLVAPDTEVLLGDDLPGAWGVDEVLGELPSGLPQWREAPVHASGVAVDLVLLKEGSVVVPEEPVTRHLRPTEGSVPERAIADLEISVLR